LGRPLTAAIFLIAVRLSFSISAVDVGGMMAAGQLPSGFTRSAGWDRGQPEVKLTRNGPGFEEYIVHYISSVKTALNIYDVGI
jgi:hypothetical protein